MENACQAKAYSGICSDKMEFIRKELRGFGLNVPDEHQGRIFSAEIRVEAEFRWTAELQEFWLNIKEKPAFIPCAFIFSRLQNAIDSFEHKRAWEDIQDPLAF